MDNRCRYNDYFVPVNKISIFVGILIDKDIMTHLSGAVFRVCDTVTNSNSTHEEYIINHASYILLYSHLR